MRISRVNQVILSGLAVVIVSGIMSSILVEDVYADSSRFRVYGDTTCNIVSTTTKADNGEYPYTAGTKVHVILNGESDKVDKVVVSGNGTIFEAEKNDKGQFDFIMPAYPVKLNLKLKDENKFAAYNYYGKGIDTTIGSDNSTYPYSVGDIVKIRLNDSINSENMAVKKVSLIGEDGTRYETVQDQWGTYDFTMPQQDVRVDVEFCPIDEVKDKLRYQVYSYSGNGVSTSTSSDEGHYPYKEGEKVHIFLNSNDTSKLENVEKVLLIGNDTKIYEAVKNEQRGTYDFTMPGQRLSIVVKFKGDSYEFPSKWIENSDGSWSLWSNGQKLTGWQKAEGKWYHLDNTGIMTTGGWFKDDNNGNWYYLNSDGSMASNCSIGGYNLGVDGVWIQ